MADTLVFRTTWAGPDGVFPAGAGADDLPAARRAALVEARIVSPPEGVARPPAPSAPPAARRDRRGGM